MKAKQQNSEHKKKPQEEHKEEHVGESHHDIHRDGDLLESNKGMFENVKIHV